MFVCTMPGQSTEARTGAPRRSSSRYSDSVSATTPALLTP